MAKSSMKYLGTVTPYKGLRVYTRSAMGMPGSSETLQELLPRVLGDLMQKDFVVVIADDIHVGGNKVGELLPNWSLVLQRMQENNLSLSAKKTVICPSQAVILGWIWKAGTLQSSHQTAPLSSVEHPTTCSSMRSFIGALKAVSKCIPPCASLVAPLEDSIGGLQGPQAIIWTPDLSEHFRRCQERLRPPKTITIPIS